MIVATTYEERMDLIAKLAPRYNKLAAAKRSAMTAGKASKRKGSRSFMKVPGEGENPNHYTDASKYAKEYYGETMHETTRFDNDWGDY